jgi:hypothetical protein
MGLVHVATACMAERQVHGRNIHEIGLMIAHKKHIVIIKPYKVLRTRHLQAIHFV